MAQTLIEQLADLETHLQVAYYEGQSEKFDFFNANSRGSIILTAGAVTGVTPESGYFVQSLSNGGRRSATATTARTKAGLTQDTFKSVVTLGQQYDDVSISTLFQRGIDPQSYVTSAGKNMADNKLRQTFADAISALVGSIGKQGDTIKDVSADGSSNTSSIDNLLLGKEKMGDHSTDIVALVMHSKPYSNLLREMGSNPEAATQIAQGIIMSGAFKDVLGAVVIVTDNSALKVDLTSSVAYNQYKTLMLTANACTIKDQETVPMILTQNNELENVTLSSVTEYNQDLRVKGFSYAGSDYPTAATLAATASWTLKAADIKIGPGVMLISR